MTNETIQSTTNIKKLDNLKAFIPVQLAAEQAAPMNQQAHPDTIQIQTQVDQSQVPRFRSPLHQQAPISIPTSNLEDIGLGPRNQSQYQAHNLRRNPARTVTYDSHRNDRA